MRESGKGSQPGWNRDSGEGSEYRGSMERTNPFTWDFGAINLKPWKSHHGFQL
jgi:hypothetical protein